VIRTRVPLANSISIVTDAGANMRASAAIATDANELPQLTHCLNTGEPDERAELRRLRRFPQLRE
jgi:hypothetical protein